MKATRAACTHSAWRRGDSGGRPSKIASRVVSHESSPLPDRAIHRWWHITAAVSAGPAACRLTESKACITMGNLSVERASFP